jgi:hypothetical protein
MHIHVQASPARQQQISCQNGTPLIKLPFAFGWNFQCKDQLQVALYGIAHNRSSLASVRTTLEHPLAAVSAIPTQLPKMHSSIAHALPDPAAELAWRRDELVPHQNWRQWGATKRPNAFQRTVLL